MTLTLDPVSVLLALFFVAVLWADFLRHWTRAWPWKGHR